MGRIINVDVDIDIDEYMDDFLDALDDDDLLEEVENRKLKLEKQAQEDRNKVCVDKDKLFVGDTFKRTLCDMFDISYYTDNDKLLDLVKENL